MRDDQKTKDNLIDELNHLRKNAQRLESQIRRAEKDFKDSQQQLQQAQKMEALGTLVAGVAHEINNPINLIMYNLPLLQKIWTDFFGHLCFWGLNRGVYHEGHEGHKEGEKHKTREKASFLGFKWGKKRREV